MALVYCDGNVSMTQKLSLFKSKLSLDKLTLLKLTVLRHGKRNMINTNFLIHYINN